MSLRAATILSKTEKGLWQALASHGTDKSVSTTFFAVNAPQSSLSGVFKLLSSSFRSSNIGCLSASPTSDYPYSVSYLSIPESVQHRVWRSTIPGERSQVGRWYSPEQRNKENFDLSSESNDSGSRVAQLPPVLQELKQSKSRISGLLYVTDNSIDGLRESLRHYLLSTPQLGLIAAQTPFITGRPFTLFHNDKFYSDGAIGIAFMDGVNLTINTYAPALEKLPGSASVTVTSAAANLIYELDGKSAARTFGQFLSAAGRNDSGHEVLSKATSVYLAHRDGDGNITRVYTISGGSFHSGQLLLDGDVSPSVGTVLELVAFDTKDGVFRDLTSSGSDAGPTVRVQFACIPSEDELGTTRGNNHWRGQDVVQESTLIATSDMGFTLSEGKDVGRSWISTIPYTQGVATFRL